MRRKLLSRFFHLYLGPTTYGGQVALGLSVVSALLLRSGLGCLVCAVPGLCEPW